MRADTKIIFEMFDTDSKAVSTPSCSQAQTDINTLKNEKADTNNYATTEVNGFYLDGSYKFASALPSGLYSDSVSDADGSLAQPVVLTVDFDSYVTSNGITLNFPKNEYPSLVDIKWYSGDNLLSEGQYSPAEKVFFCKNNVENYDRLVLTFYGTKVPYHYIKLCGIDYGQSIEFSGDNLIKSRVAQDIDLLCDEISVNTLEFTAEDKDRLFSAVSENSVFFAAQENQKISVYSTIGGEQKKVGTFYLKNIIGSGITAQFTAQDVVGLLDDEDELEESWYDTDFENFCGQILQGIKYTVADSLKAERIKGYLPSGSRREALQQACFAVGAVADTQGGDTLNIYPPQDKPTQLLKSSQIFAGGKVESIKPVKQINLTVHSFDTAGIDAPTVETVYMNEKAKQQVEITEAYFVNADNAQKVMARLVNYYGRKVQYRFSVPLDRFLLLGDMLMTYLDNSYIKGNIVQLDVNMSGGLVADIVMRGWAFGTTGDIFAGEIYAGERSAGDVAAANI